MLLDPFKDVVLIILYFHVALKFDPLTFTRVMLGDEDPFGLTSHVVYIIWYQEMAPQVAVGLTPISYPLG